LLFTLDRPLITIGDALFTIDRALFTLIPEDSTSFPKKNQQQNQ
jgi:hypothetical protein